MDKLISLKIKLIYKIDLDCEECAEITGWMNLKDKFIELSLDEETEEFINNCFQSEYQLFMASYKMSWFAYFYT